MFDKTEGQHQTAHNEGRATRATSHTPALVLTYTAGLLAAISYGVTFILPLYVAKALHGTEADTGSILFVASIGTLLCVPFVGYLADRYTAHRLAAVASALFGIGMLMLLIAHSIGLLLYIAGFFFGCGWGIFFTSTPMIVTKFVGDAQRSLIFSILSGFQMIGIGGGPIAAQALLSLGFDFRTLFLLSLLGNLIAALLLLMIRAESGTDPKNSPSIKQFAAIGSILASPALYPIIMVFLGACIFSSLFNFQTTFAAQAGLTYTVFYASYTIVVILARFTIAGLVGRMHRDIATIGLLVIMTSSIVGFLIVDHNNVVYFLSAVLLGLGYGLVYPLIQAQAVSATPPGHHSLVLTLFSVSYFLGIFAFPLLGGVIIVRTGYTVLFVVLLALSLLETLMAILRAYMPRTFPLTSSSRRETQRTERTI